MFDRIAQWQPDRGADVAARTVGALALIALAVIHVVDLPGTLGPTPLVGIGYLGIIAAAVLMGGVLLAQSNWLAWAAAAGVAVSLNPASVDSGPTANLLDWAAAGPPHRPVADRPGNHGRLSRRLPTTPRS